MVIPHAFYALKIRTTKENYYRRFLNWVSLKLSLLILTIDYNFPRQLNSIWPNQQGLFLRLLSLARIPVKSEEERLQQEEESSIHHLTSQKSLYLPWLPEKPMHQYLYIKPQPQAPISLTSPYLNSQSSFMENQNTSICSMRSWKRGRNNQGG